MLEPKILKSAYGSYGNDTLGIIPEHKRWVLKELLSEMDEFYKRYGASGDGSFLKLYHFNEEWKRGFSAAKPICTFKFDVRYRGLVESEFTKDQHLMNTEVFCDIGYGFWNCDTWYAYLATPPKQETDQTCNERHSKNKCFVVGYNEKAVKYEDDVEHCVECVFLSLDNALQYCRDKGLEIERIDVDEAGESSIDFKPDTSHYGFYTRTYYIEQYDFFS